MGSSILKKDKMGIDIYKPIEAIGNIADNLFTSDEERGNIDLQKLKYQLDVLKESADIMKAELQSGRGKWRSAIGWICAYCLGLYFAVQPTFGFITHVLIFFSSGKWTPISFDITEMIELFASILCIGTLKTIEKRKAQNIK